MTKRTILLGEDEEEVRDYLETALRCRGYEVECAVDGSEVLDYVRRRGPLSAILLDIMMPGRDGLETLAEIRQLNAQVPVLMLSGMSQPSNVVRAMRIGATDFLSKPVTPDELAEAIQTVLDQRSRVSRPNEPLETSTPVPYIGSSFQTAKLESTLSRIASSDVPVLIQGETGTGKEVLARRVHSLSRRAAAPFVKLNCAAVPAELTESELFGYERGAFTGAFQKKLGIFDLADGGTIFLDEIGDMDIRLQAKLLQVLQDQEFRRLGGKENVRVDVRVIAATHRDLRKAIGQNLFREDLYYRLNAFTLSLPSLRESKEDIVPLAEFLLRRHSSKHEPPALTLALEKALEDYDWPGNVRQLENIVRKFLVLRDPDLIAAELCIAQMERTAAPASPSGPGPAVVYEHASRAVQENEIEAMLAALESSRWNRKEAAAILNVDYRAFLYKMKKLKLTDRPLARQKVLSIVRVPGFWGESR